MPKGSYQNVKLARKNAKLIIKKTGCDGVKLRVIGIIIKLLKN